MSIFNIFKKKAQTEKKDTGALEAVISSLEKQEIIIEVDHGAKDILPDAGKLGGKPWLPSDFEWPMFTDTDEGKTRPLSFLCQIALADVKKYDADGLLPDSGMLYFFYDCEAFRWGFDPSDKGSARVFYFESTDGFVPLKLPDGLAKEHIVPEMAMSFSVGRSFPGYEELGIYTDIGHSRDEFDEVLKKIGIDTAQEHHKLLGYADIIQDEMLTECERVSRGIYCGDAKSYKKISKTEKASIERSAKDWTLLLQLTTLEKGEWELMWGDCGMLYFYIKKQDLAEKRFENARFSLQCC